MSQLNLNNSEMKISINHVMIYDDGPLFFVKIVFVLL